MRTFEHGGRWYICGAVKEVSRKQISGTFGAERPKRYEPTGWLLKDHSWSRTSYNALSFATREEAEEYLYAHELEIPNP